MAKAVIANRKPKQVHLELGEYYWCACGRSKNQPFCDGSHRNHFEHDAVAFDLPPKPGI